MAGLNALSVRDLVALTVIASRTCSSETKPAPAVLVREAYAVADAFVTQSEARWATAARSSHEHNKPPGNPPGQ